MKITESQLSVTWQTWFLPTFSLSSSEDTTRVVEETLESVSRRICALYSYIIIDLQASSFDTSHLALYHTAFLFLQQ